jgi:predicted ABC-type ATPase
LDQRPVIVAIAGPNGAGKSTFYGAHLKPSGLRLVNADVLGRELGMDAYQAARLAGSIRERLLEQRESFVFETVFSDPAGDKLGFLQRAVKAGYNVILCFIGIAGPETSEVRVAMRVTQGGHDVPAGKLVARFPRTLENLRNSIATLPRVWVFDNEDLANPYRLIAKFENGRAVQVAERLPAWMKRVVKSIAK